METDGDTRQVDRECPFVKNPTENKITGDLTVNTEIDNESCVTIEGNRMIANFIPGIKFIHLKRKKGIIYDYTIYVYGRCPDKYKKIELTFTDGGGKTHSVHISSNTDKWHTEEIKPEKPVITEITWEFKE